MKYSQEINISEVVQYKIRIAFSPFKQEKYQENQKNQSNDDENKGNNKILSNYDQLLPYIGDMGTWQLATVAILWPPSMAAGIIVLLSSFTALEPRAFRCAL